MSNYRAGLSECTVAALFSREIDDDGAGLHGLDHSGGDQFWGGLARNECGRDDDVDLHRLLGKESHLGLEKVVGHLLGVTPLPLAFLFEVDLKKLRSH